MIIAQDMHRDLRITAVGLRIIVSNIIPAKRKDWPLEFCEAAGLSRATITKWLENGLLEAQKVGVPGGGWRREFAAGQLERARLIKMLYQKGVSSAQLSAADLAFDGQAFVIFDGHNLRACRDAATAISMVTKAKRWCSAIDLSAIRQPLLPSA